MENPYATPLTTFSDGDELQRPIGVAIFSILTGILGLVLLAAFVVLLVNWEENNQFAINRRLAPSVFWLVTGVSPVIAFAASIGMWRGRKWGWWVACTGLVLFVIDNIGRAVMVNLSDGVPSILTFLSVDSLEFTVRGIIFTGILAHWLRTRVRRYFGVEKTSRIKAVALAALFGIGIPMIIMVVLQFIFLIRTR